MTIFFHIKADPGYYFAVIAVGNLLGPLLLGRLFDVLGRKTMIAGTYLISGGLLLLTAWLFDQGRAAGIYDLGWAGQNPTHVPPLGSAPQGSRSWIDVCGAWRTAD